MIRNYSWLLAVFALGVLALSNTSFADYIGRSVFGSIVRIHDDGTVAPPPFDYSGLSGSVETPAMEITLTPDLSKVYGLANSLGFANQVNVWNTNTGARINTDTMVLGFGFPPNENYIETAYSPDYPNQPLIRGNELFALSPIFTGSFPPSVPTDWRIKRFDTTTDALLQTITPPTTQRLNDISLSATGLTLYVAGTSGIYKYVKFGSNYLLPELLIPGVDGNIALGGGALLYVRNMANGDVERYDTALGVYVDTIISHTVYPNLGTIQFGVDGNLHVYQGGSSPKILKFNSLTGGLLFSTPLPSFSIYNGRLYYLVPEPGAGLLLVMGIPAFICRSRSLWRRND